MTSVIEEGAAIPLWFKIAYTAFVCVLVPKYWIDYGPTNFLYYCDVALLMGVVALWTENPLWASMPAVGLILPQTLWIVDFLGVAIGWPLVGMTQYMFDEKIPLFTRGLSFFHFWLPFVLVWLVARLGYDSRGFLYWSGLAWALMLVCYFLIPGPPAPLDNPNLPVNVNYVFGMSEKGPQTWMPPLAWLATLMIGLPALIFWPTHLLLNRLWGKGA